MNTLLNRFEKIGRSDPMAVLPILTGTRKDYFALKAHHYRPGNPATMTRTLAIHDDRPSASDRMHGRAAAPRPVAVLVESLPALSCRLRDEALNGRYGHLKPRPRSALLNEELRCISRVIVDPRYRGLGLAVRLVKHALATATTRYTEAIAVMGRVSPFFERAAMTAYQRPPLESEQRALASLQHAGIEPLDLAMPESAARRIESLCPSVRCFVERELMRWYRGGAGRRVACQPTLNDILHAAGQRLLARPIYYLHENRHEHTR